VVVAYFKILYGNSPEKYEQKHNNFSFGSQSFLQNILLVILLLILSQCMFLSYIKFQLEECLKL